MKKMKQLLHSKTLKKKLWIFSLLTVIGLILVLSGTVFLYFLIFAGLPSPYSLKDYKAVPISSQIYDRNGKLLYEVYREENRTPVKLNTLPDYLIKATIAVEDKDFYKHGGVSLVSG